MLNVRGALTEAGLEADTVPESILTALQAGRVGATELSVPLLSPVRTVS